MSDEKRTSVLAPLELRYANRLLACFLFWIPTWERMLVDIERLTHGRA